MFRHINLCNLFRGSVIYPVPENQTVTVTLFKDSRTNELEDKDWTFVLEDVRYKYSFLKAHITTNIYRKHKTIKTCLRRTNILTTTMFQVSITGKRRRLAVASINMRKYASLEPSQRPIVVPLDATTHKIVGASIHLTLHCVLLREGQAT